MLSLNPVLLLTDKHKECRTVFGWSYFRYHITAYKLGKLPSLHQPEVQIKQKDPQESADAKRWVTVAWQICLPSCYKGT